MLPSAARKHPASAVQAGAAKRPGSDGGKAGVRWGSALGAATRGAQLGCLTGPARCALPARQKHILYSLTKLAPDTHWGALQQIYILSDRWHLCNAAAILAARQRPPHAQHRLVKCSGPPSTHTQLRAFWARAVPL